MPNAVLHRLADGRWRVTNASADWMDDGRDYPEARSSDRVFEHEGDAVREYLQRTSPADPEDQIPGEAPVDDDDWDGDSSDDG